MKTLVCCIGKNENQYVREYVEWYKKLGVTNICLYDNNDLDGEHFEEVISDYIDEGFVEIRNWRGKKQCQLASYQDCYDTYGNDYDWILFIDCGDEYLYLTRHKNISEYLSSILFKNFELIHVNLMTYGDCGLVHNDGRPLMERFTEAIPYDRPVAYNFPENYHVSSIVKGGLGQRVKFNVVTHTPYPCDLKCCNASGLKSNAESPFQPYNFSMAYFKHFTTKTAEEYCNKMKRGFLDQLWDGSRIQNLVETRFFRTNEVTKEKIDVFKERLGIDMSYLLTPISVDGKREDVKIYSLCFEKKNFKFLDDSVVTPLQVGASYTQMDVCSVKDNTGENISQFNQLFIENTGTFWIWKNVHAKYKGQMQYRRPLSGVNETMDFDKVFENYDVITCEPFNHPSHKTPTAEEPMVINADTVEQGYAFSNCLVDLQVVENIIKKKYPGYSDAYDKYIKNGPDLYYSNGFIMREADYDMYCMFLFDILQEYLNAVGIRSILDLYFHVGRNMGAGLYGKEKYPNPFAVSPGDIRWQTSILGFLSERIWTLWLLANIDQSRIYKLPYVKQEEGMYT